MKRLLLFFVIFIIALSFASQTGADTSLSGIYKIKINDVLSIKVLDNEELNTLATVTSDGTITFPYIGNISVKGMSLPEIDETITKKLSEGYIKYPVVTVYLMQSMSRKIYAYGELNKRGEVIYEDGMTIIRTMSIVGGVSRDGLFGKLIVRRKGGDSNEYKDLVEADIDNGFISDQKIEDMLLKPDDILIVERNKTFLIQGEVAKRGRFVLEKDMTVLRALLEAGGVSENGSYGRIKVRRKQGGMSGEYKYVAESKINDGVIDNGEVEDTVLQPDDILIVEKNKTFLIEGEVAKRGRFVLEKDMTVLRALLQAGGVSEDGIYGRIKLRRKQEGKLGGYKDIIESKINDRVIESSEVEDTVLQHDDILIIERSKTYLIYGEAARTGEFLLTDDMTVFKALTIAGGFTKWGSASRVKILRPRNDNSGFETIKVNIDDIIEGDATADVFLEPGDTVVISAGVF
jgi:polysaccharide export outer membrane protein